MKVKIIVIVMILAALIISSCRKNSNHYPLSNSPLPQLPPQVTITPVLNSCGSRPIINAILVPVGSLSIGRIEMLAATAGNKILFAGGYPQGGLWWNSPITIDIYDFVSNTWLSSSLLTGFRIGATISAIGNKVLIAGGGDGFGDIQTPRVDIYDASTNTWSIAQLSNARAGLASASAGNKVLFAGGHGYPDGVNFGCYNTVDIYDNTTNAWTTATLSEARTNLVATTVGNKIYFAGGTNYDSASKVIDIYDAVTNSWTISNLLESKSDMAQIAADGKIYWAGGRSQIPGTHTWSNSSRIEIRDVVTGGTSFGCILPRNCCQIVRKNDNLFFFTGFVAPYDPQNGTHFEIYNTTTNTWSTGKLNQTVLDAAIISVNNIIYVAGGRNNSGTHFNQLWKLEF